MAETEILIGKSATRAETLLLRFANRHGLVTGATGTGKTVTLQVLAEGFSNAGVPVFAADIKGDLSGLSQPGDGKEPFLKRAREIGVEYVPDRFPTIFWDVLGEQGHPVRATISEMGPLLLARLLDLNETQEGVLNIAFRVADEQGLLLLDLKDLRAMLAFVAENAASLGARYGNVSAQSVGAIQRQLLVLENQRGENFFGEPALEIADLMRTDRDGRGVVSILAASRLMDNPRLYATFLLWLLSELFEELPEVGDLDKPKLVFFFDEAHLLFDGAPKALVDAVERVVRLIRSKGVGVYFVTQNPLDIPEKVLAQLGNRIQHALRAFTPRDQKAVRAAAETFRQNPAFKTEEAILSLGVGEALVSTLDAKGAPTMVERTLIAPPSGRVGPASDQERQSIMAASPVRGRYDRMIDRESAYEMLQRRAGESALPSRAGETTGSVPRSGPWEQPAPASPRAPSRERAEPARPRQTRSETERIVTSVATSAARSIGTQIGRAIFRSILGGMTRR